LALILDTGPLYASLDRRDADYRACRELIENSLESLVVPEPVLAEVDYLAHRRLQPGAFVAVLESIVDGGLKVESLTSDDYIRVRDICDRYADAGVGFVDAAVLAITERLGEPKLATLDRRHFSLLRPRHVDALELLP
jgi:uncharacterized protein